MGEEWEQILQVQGKQIIEIRKQNICGNVYQSRLAPLLCALGTSTKICLMQTERSTFHFISLYFSLPHLEFNSLLYPLMYVHFSKLCQYPGRLIVRVICYCYCCCLLAITIFVPNSVTDAVQNY